MIDELLTRHPEVKDYMSEESTQVYDFVFVLLALRSTLL